MGYNIKSLNLADNKTGHICLSFDKKKAVVIMEKAGCKGGNKKALPLHSCLCVINCTQTDRRRVISLSLPSEADNPFYEINSY